MFKMKKSFALLITAFLLASPGGLIAKKSDNAASNTGEITAPATPVLWRNPTDIATRDVFYGPGGKEHAPQPAATYTFLKEDLNGTNPKFVVSDQDGVKWKVKLGAEARPEVVASRLVWAAGYFANEDYFLERLHPVNMPAHLERRHADKYLQPDGSVLDVRLKRDLKNEKKIGTWEWRSNPFAGTREWNGLRVLMALINNWDLKDINNGIYREKNPDGGSDLVYMVTDLGSSFGTVNFIPNHEKAKGNLESYINSRFIRKVGGNSVDFNDPQRPALVVLANPHEYVMRLNEEWIGRKIPLADARWMGQLLAKLSPDQIRDAFRAAGYPPDQVEEFASVVESRIGQLNHL